MTQEKQERKLNSNGNRRGMHPNSQKNIKNGQNKNGRPKNSLCLTSAVKAKLDQVCPYDTQGRTWLEYLADKWLCNAAFNAQYFRDLTERLEGKVTQPVEAEVKGELSQTFNFILPDGSKLKASELVKVNGNRD